MDEKGEVVYKLTIAGMHHDKTYELWIKWIDGSVAKMLENIRVNDSGELVVPVKGEEYDVLIPLHNMREAEPIEFALISKDKTIKAFDQIIPFPVRAQNPDGCQLEYGSK